MKKISLTILVIILIAIFSCDRFEHEIYENAQIEAAFNEFSNAIETADTLSIISYYHNDYKHYGDTLETVMFKFADSTGYVHRYNNLTTTLDEYYKDLSIRWTLYGIPNYSDNLQKIKSFSDYLITADGPSFKFYGNQLDTPPLYNPSKPMIVAQFSTSTTCGNCPAGAEKLAELQREYGGQFIYLEYMSDGPDPATNFIPFAQYYNIPSQPTAIFQGESIAAGGDAETINSYSTRYEQAAEIEKTISINLENIEINGSSISGTAIIGDLENVPISDLKLETALILKHSDYEYNNGHQKLHNVVFASETIDIESAEINFSLDSTIEITEETLFVVWVQTKEDPYNFQTCKIYDALTYELTNKVSVK